MSSVLDTMIFDRTSSDIKLANDLIKKGYQNLTDEEKAVWNTDLKGTLNASDLNRVGNALRYIEQYLKDMNYYRIEMSSRNDFEVNDIPLLEDLNKYLSDTEKVLEQLKSELYEEMPTTFQNWNYQKQNILEKNIYLIKQTIQSLEEGMQSLAFTLGGDEFE